MPILRVLSADPPAGEQFLQQLKADLKHDWAQNDVLIVCREVNAL